MHEKSRVAKRLDAYESLNPMQRVEMELFLARKRPKNREALHREAEEALLWLIEQDPAGVNVAANFRKLRARFNY